MRKHKKTNLTKLLQPIVSAACVWALLLGLILPVAATETVSTEAGDPVITESTAESSLLDTIRSEVAAFIETYGLTPDMPDQVLADVYTALDGEQSQAAWNKLNELLVLAEGLTKDEADTLLAETNTKLCQRFYNIIVQINSPAFALDKTFDSANGLIDGISVNVKGDDKKEDQDSITTGNIDAATGIVTATVKAHTSEDCWGNSQYNKNKVTITIYNTTGGRANLSFDWETFTDNSDYCQHGAKITIANTNADGTNGTHLTQQPLDADGETSYVTVVMQSCDQCTKSSVLNLSNFSITPVKDASATFVYDSTLGSVSAGGNVIASGEAATVTAAGLEITATANPGAIFLGWINESSGEIFRLEASTTLNLDADISLRAMFISASDSGWYLTGGTRFMNDLNEAAAFAQTAGQKTVILMNDASLPAGDYTIPSGVTLLIPFDDDNTLYTTSPGTSSSYTPPSPYRTLTMKSGAAINVSDGGAISVSSQYSVSGQNTNSRNGTPTGKYGWIKMDNGSSIVLGSGANLYAYGFITGEGTITAGSGSKVHELFQNLGWRGGTASTNKVFENNKVFPVAQYYIQNIEVPLTLEYGASEVVYTGVTVSSVAQTTSTTFIGSGGLFKMSSGSSVRKRYDPETDRLIFDIYGDVSLSSFELSFAWGMYKFNTANYVLPLNSNFTVNIHSGNATVDQKLAILPGAKIYIGKDTTVTLPSSSSLYVYDRDEWMTGMFAHAQGYLNPVPYTPTKKVTRTTDHLVDAVMDINGKAILQGYGYTTAGGASIISSEGTGSVEFVNGAGTATNTWQVANTTATSIPITSAKLKNADGTYVATGEKGAGTYKYINGKWYKSIEIDSTNIAIGSGLDMYFYVKASDVGDDLDSYKAVVTKHFSDWDKEDSIQTYESTEWMPYPDATNIQYYRFGFSDISAKEMTDEIDAVIYHVDGTQVSKVYTQTIQNYVIQALEKYKNDTTRKTELLKAALMDMLEYGTSAQEQFGYNVNNPANKDPEKITTLADHATYISADDQEPNWKNVKDYGNYTNIAGVTASATNTLMFTFYFNVTNISGMYAEVEYLAHGETEKTFKTINKFYERIENELYGVDVTTLSIVDGHQPIKCTLYNADGSVAAVATDSIGSYAMRNKDNGAIFRDMMQFVDSALAYFDYKE